MIRSRPIASRRPLGLQAMERGTSGRRGRMRVEVPSGDQILTVSPERIPIAFSEVVGLPDTPLTKPSVHEPGLPVLRFCSTDSLWLVASLRSAPRRDSTRESTRGNHQVSGRLGRLFHRTTKSAPSPRRILRQCACHRDSTLRPLRLGCGLSRAVRACRRYSIP